MKSSNIFLENQNYNFSCNQFKANSHYKFIMSMGRAIPTTKAQANFFVKNKISIDLLNSKDVDLIESMLNKHGMQGDYKFTKSKTWVRLLNNEDLHKAISLEFLR